MPVGVEVTVKLATTNFADPDLVKLDPYGVVPEPVMVTLFWPTGPVQEREVVFDPSRIRMTLGREREQVTPEGVTRERDTAPNKPFTALTVTVAFAWTPGPTDIVEGLGVMVNPGGGTRRLSVGPRITRVLSVPVTLIPKICETTVLRTVIIRVMFWRKPGTRFNDDGTSVALGTSTPANPVGLTTV